MTVKEFYDVTGGGYEEMFSKFHNDALIIRFLKMFSADGNFAQLKAKLEEGDVEGAFGAVHNVKGLTLNLNIVGMTAPVHAVTEALRAGDLEGARAAFPQLNEAYGRVITALKGL